MSADGRSHTLDVGSNRLRLTLAGLAVLVWGWPFLAPESLFWDDWLQLAGNPLQIYQDLGFPWVGSVVFTLMLAGPWAVKAVALAATIATTLAVFEISGRGLGISPRARWLLAAVSAVVPLNVAHGSVGVLALYTTCLGLFMVAWWILITGPEGVRPAHWRTLLAATLFLASFTTASLLVFVVVPAIHFCVVYRDRDRPVMRELLDLSWRYWYLVAAPVGFWIVRELWFTPSVAYANYNHLQLPTSMTSPFGAGLLLCAVALIATVTTLAASAVKWQPFGADALRVGLIIAGVLTGMWAVFMTWTLGVVNAAGAIVVVTLAASGLVLAASGTLRRPIRRPPVILALSGLALVAIGYVPYLLVQKLPTFEEWGSRHQLLLPFGIAALVVSAMILVAEHWNRRLAKVVTGGVIMAMALAAAAAPISLALDWRKQEQLISLLRHEPQIKSARTVEFTDLSTSWNFSCRTYRFYEYTALLRAAYGGENRLGGDSEAITLAMGGNLRALEINAPMYGVAEWNDDGTRTLVTIMPREGAHAWGPFFGQPSMELMVESVG